MDNYEVSKERAKTMLREARPALALLNQEDRETFIACMFVIFSAQEVVQAMQELKL